MALGLNKADYDFLNNVEKNRNIEKNVTNNNQESSSNNNNNNNNNNQQSTKSVIH